jgi:hypothetical protein
MFGSHLSARANVPIEYQEKLIFVPSAGIAPWAWGQCIGVLIQDDGFPTFSAAVRSFARFFATGV